jgi:hypothetical protein
VESSCEFGIEPLGSIQCWETIECPGISQVVLSSMDLVSYGRAVVRLFAVFPPRWPGFKPKSGKAGLVVDKVTLGQVFSKYFSFICHLSGLPFFTLSPAKTGLIETGLDHLQNPSLLTISLNALIPAVRMASLLNNLR